MAAGGDVEVIVWDNGSAPEIAQRLDALASYDGVLWELEAIAAVIIGGTALKGGRGRVWGTVVGVLILSLIDNILNLADLVSPYLNGAIQGVIIVLAVVLQREKRAAE